MKKLILIVAIILTSIVTAQDKNNLLTITLDGSRLIEDTSEYDSGLDIVATLTMLRQHKVRPLIKFEAFPNLQYYKTAIGVEYVIPIYTHRELLFELVASAEAGMISRSTNEYEAYFGFITYGFNGEIRLFKPFNRIPIIASYNLQKRTDFDIYNTTPEFVGSLYLGLGYSF